MPRYREEQIIAAAHFYYIEGYTHEEIAKRLDTSRIAVTRMLKRAREEEIVQITIKKPLPLSYQLSLDLERAFGLSVAKVVPTMGTPEETQEAMGRAGAELLLSMLRPRFRIGVAWSKTVSAILPYIKQPHPHVDCRVNELAGTYLAPHIPYSVSWQLAEKLKVPLESIPVPVLLKSEESKNMMLQEEMIHTGLANARNVDIALVGIGNVSSTSSLARTGYLDETHIEEIRQKGAVGDILMRYFDRQGRHVPISFDDRVVSLKWEELGKLRFVVAIVFGKHKVEAVLGALAGGMIHGIITDRETAELLLAGERVGKDASVTGDVNAGGTGPATARQDR